MPNFSARIVGGSEVPWEDLPSASYPTRLNPDPDHIPSFRRIDAGVSPVTIEVRAIVNGVEAPFDAALGGNLFSAAWAEWSGTAPPPIVQSSGQTSLTSISVTGSHAGHFCLSLTRTNGGGILIHFDVVST